VATPKEDNPLWMLRTFYFVPCDLMHQQVIRLKAQFFANEKLNEQAEQEVFISFFLYWLASLFVVVDGWKSLKISEPNIDKMIGNRSHPPCRVGVLGVASEDGWSGWVAGVAR
jgi:hypothetical protein